MENNAESKQCNCEHELYWYEDRNSWKYKVYYYKVLL